MKKTSILIISVLVLILIASLISCGDNKSEKSEGSEGLEFYPYGDGSEYAVECGDAKYLEKIVIPEKHDGKPVTTIKKGRLYELRES